MNTATVNMIMELLSGLALFLFGMNYMSHSLQQAAGGKLRVFLDKCTKNRVIAALFGTFFTALIQSSGATTVMVVGFVNAGILPLVKSVGLIFGANIGTTITSQIVSLKLVTDSFLLAVRMSLHALSEIIRKRYCCRKRSKPTKLYSESVVAFSFSTCF